MKISTEDFRVREGASVDLKKWPTLIHPYYRSREDYAAMLESHTARLSACQALLYAAGTHAVLLIFQAMDAAGKDGAIKHVMSGINPQGCQVFSYKRPSSTELAHDFLWRTTRDLPERGRIGIFNRSYYEEVLVVRVHPDLLAAEGVGEDDAKLWRHRYRAIRNYERHLHESGTQVVKFFLHLSKEEQRKRFLARIDDARRNWKLSAADVEERAYWKDYMRAYEQCLEETSTAASPWHVVPADDKENARLVISEIVLRTLEGLPMSWPEATEQRRAELQAARARLEGE